MASSWFSLYSTIKMMHGPINISIASLFSFLCDAEYLNIEHKYGHLLEQHTAQCGRHVPSEHAASICGTENTEVTGLSDTWIPTYLPNYMASISILHRLKAHSRQNIKFHTRNVSLSLSLTHTHMYTYTYIHTYKHAYINIRTYIHTYTHTYIRTYIHTYIYTCTYTHTYIYTYIHTYIHIHTKIHTYVMEHKATFLISCAPISSLRQFKNKELRTALYK